MARRVIGITVERRTAVIRASGTVADGECAINPDDCCDGAGSGQTTTSCCSELEKLNLVSFVLQGNLTSGSAFCQTSGTLANTHPRDLIWYLFDVDDNGCPIALNLTLYCEGTGWRLSGYVNIDGYPDVVYFDVAADSDPDSVVLVFEFDVPKRGTVIVAVESPCTVGGSGSGPGDNALTVCIGSYLDSLPATLTLVMPAGSWACSATAGTYTMTSFGSGDTRTWITTGIDGYSSVTGPGPCNGTNYLTLSCQMGQFALTASTSIGGAFSGAAPLVAGTRVPMSAAFIMDGGIFDSTQLGVPVTITVHQ